MEDIVTPPMNETVETLQCRLMSLYEEIEQAIKETKAVENEKYRTNCGFRWNPTNDYSKLSIDTTLNEAELLNVYAFIKEKSRQYDAAAAEIGLQQYQAFKWCGHLAEDWLHDVKLRFRFIKYQARLNDLNAKKAKIEPHLPQQNKLKQLLLELG